MFVEMLMFTEMFAEMSRYINIIPILTVNCIWFINQLIDFECRQAETGITMMDSRKC